MNRTILIGNVATDIEVKQTQGGVSRATFKIAVQRRFANAQGVRDADFIPVTAWRQQADFLSKYAAKGDRVAISGSIQVRNYDAQDGTKRYVTEINADEVELVSRKGGGHEGAKGGSAGNQTPVNKDGFIEVGDDDQLPF